MWGGDSALYYPALFSSGSQLGSLIVDNRQFVNTIFLEKYGEVLLTLPQEGSLVDFFKFMNSEDEFGMRLI